jgi:hypothetical protein
MDPTIDFQLDVEEGSTTAIAIGLDTQLANMTIDGEATPEAKGSAADDGKGQGQGKNPPGSPRAPTPPTPAPALELPAVAAKVCIVCEAPRIDGSLQTAHLCQPLL